MSVNYCIVVTLDSRKQFTADPIPGCIQISNKKENPPQCLNTTTNFLSAHTHGLGVANAAAYV